MTASKIRADEGLQAALSQLNAYASSFGRDSEDLVQEALTRAIANGVPVEAVPWLRTVMRRLAIDRSRRAREVLSGDSFDMDAMARDPGQGPEDLVLSGERAAAVREALATLPPRYREALLSYANNGKASAVAEQMSLSSQATWTLLCRARDRLRTQLERVGFVPAAFVAKIAPWWPAAATGAVAVCLFATFAPLAPKAKDAPAGSPTRVQAAAISQTVLPPAPAPATAVTRTAATNHTSASRPVVARTSTTAAEYKAKACTDARDPGGTPISEKDRPIAASVWVEFRDDDDASISESVIAAAPAEVRSMTVSGGCK